MSERGNISDEAVQKATGKSWEVWFELLDREGCAEMDHKSIAKLINENHETGGWWSQMVTVEYERSRGLRKMNEKIGGYEVSVSRTLVTDLSTLYTRAKELILPQAELIRTDTRACVFPGLTKRW